MKAPQVSPGIEATIHRLRAGAQNLLSRLPGDRPGWVVFELTGLITARARRPRFFGVPVPPALIGGGNSLEEIAATIELLRDADWLSGVVFRIEGMMIDAATAFGLRRAISKLREGGKRTIAFLSRVDLMAQYVASAAEEIVCPESADFALAGLGVSMTFYRDALARFGVRFEKVAIDEYKTAFDSLVRQEMSPAHREQMEVLLESFERQFLGEIATGRGITFDDVKTAVESGIVSAADAKRTKLIDRIAYEDEIIDARHKHVADAYRFMRVPLPPPRTKRIAVVSLTGPIVSGRSRGAPIPVPPFGGSVSGSDSVVSALRIAASDPQTAAVVFHVDSGGGSALASDLIWREVQRIMTKKPVVGVMGAVAASGGYYVLAGATRIVAAPTTITGSIGVLAGKPVLEGMFAKFGLNEEQITRGRYALMFHPVRAWDEAAKDLVVRHTNDVYERFLQRVAEGRKKSRDDVHALARGRIYSGTDAKNLGLVDQLGDVQSAVDLARELSGVGADAPVWNVATPNELVLPSQEDPTTFVRLYGGLFRETTLCMLPALLRVL
ncbi:MAG: signal peptide peptidase SppA [Polyangiaceae bacterium]|nr:signal peptide peptidase SppA [Polyangiaceae bacterium]